jgi:hypothetical protein
MRLNEFVRTGIFIGYKMDPASAKILNDWTRRIGLEPTPADKLHVTLIKTDSPKISVDRFNCIGRVNIPINCSTSKILKYQYGSYNNDAIALPFECKELHKRKQEIETEYGLKSSQKLEPHISLSYKVDSPIHHKVLENIELPIKHFILVEEFATPPDPHWVAKLEESDWIPYVSMGLKIFAVLFGMGWAYYAKYLRPKLLVGTKILDSKDKAIELFLLKEIEYLYKIYQEELKSKYEGHKKLAEQEVQLGIVSIVKRCSETFHTTQGYVDHILRRILSTAQN